MALACFASNQHLCIGHDIKRKTVLQDIVPSLAGENIEPGR